MGGNSSWLQDTPKAGHQQQEQQLWDKVFKKGKNSLTTETALQGEKREYFLVITL